MYVYCLCALYWAFKWSLWLLNFETEEVAKEQEWELPRVVVVVVVKYEGNAITSLVVARQEKVTVHYYSTKYM